MQMLKGPHLICLHFFKGRGYDEEFIENIKIVHKNISKFEVVESPDNASDFPALKAEAFGCKDCDWRNACDL